MTADTEQIGPEKWARIQQIFHEALEADPADLDAFVDRACGGDATLEREVRALLAGHRSDGPDFERIIGDVADGALSREAIGPGARVGPYSLLSRLGEGGMGVVYLAERADDEFRQRVAVKVVKDPGLGDEILQRFRAERQILANLNHPNIARLLDGGTTDDKLPYIVMEYVDGENIDQYCDRHRLTTNERIALFRKVCAAVHLAHQNLVVHRDLKPSNIVVSPEGEPKLLDFGIAKLLAPGAAASPAVTRFNARVLTPEHASPEQVQGKPITTASDVYSLGVLLFQILTGRLPYSVDTAEPRDLEHAICETQAPRPSTAVLMAREASDATTEAAAGVDIGTARNTSIESLKRTLSGDLDNIVLKALRKEPQRRYGSARELSEDLGRFLNNEPVQARPETLSYISAKFVQRNLGAVIAAGLTTLLVAALVAFYTVQLAAERDAARTEAAKADEIADFLMDMFAVSDPSASRGQSVTARELLDDGAARVSLELADQPEVQARMMNVIGSVYSRLALYDDAYDLLSDALELRERTLGSAHPDTLESRFELAMVHDERREHDTARALFRQEIDYRREVYGEGSVELATALHQLANSFLFEFRYDDAEPLLREALAIQRVAEPPVPGALADTLVGLATILRHNGRYREAEPLYGQALRLRETLFGRMHPSVAETLNHQARLATQQGDHARAEPLAREALAIRRQVFGNDHPATGASIGSLAGILAAQGDYQEAETLRRETLKIVTEVFGPEHEYALAARVSLSRVLIELDRLAEAETLARESLALRERVYDTPGPRLAHSQQAVAAVLLAAGDAAAAEPLLRDALTGWRTTYDDDNPRVLGAQGLLGEALLRQGRAEAALPLLESAHDGHVKQFGADAARSQELAALLEQARP
ncbi:MAG: serine/threonine-protein kinase [Pseudomonadota bacterium]